MSNKRFAVRYVAAGMIGIAILSYILALVLGVLPEKGHSIDSAAIVLIIVAAATVSPCYSAPNGRPHSLKR